MIALFHLSLYTHPSTNFDSSPYIKSISNDDVRYHPSDVRAIWYVRRVGGQHQKSCTRAGTSTSPNPTLGRYTSTLELPFERTLRDNFGRDRGLEPQN